MTTRQLVNQLKQSDQDGEFYPTTEEMIQVVRRRIPEDAKSIIDIGSGDGRVLKILAGKCKSAKLYGIEKSSILLNAQPDLIIPLGTELFEQNLSSLLVDYIFSNPPYSQYEDWVCKIVDEGFSKNAFLIIPQRWKDSAVIAKALKRRGASARVIHSDDFLDGDRPSRAFIDIVEVSFPKDRYGDKVKDPFDIWFDQHIETFDKVEEFEEDEVSKELAKKYADSSIDEMVEGYHAEYARLEENYRAVFKLDYAILQELGINKDNVRDGLKMKIAGLKTKYWQILFDRLDAITSRLSTASKKKLLEKLTGNVAVEFTTSNAYSVVIWAIKNANKYFDEQLVDLFFDLSFFEGVKNYKSNVKTWEKDGWRYGNHNRENTHYVLDYRIVVHQSAAMTNISSSRWEYPGNLYKDCHNLIADIIAVMSNLGFSTVGPRSKDREWSAGKWQDFLDGKGDILFQVKAYFNGNMHLRFSQKAIMSLNVSAGRLLKWVRTEEEVVSEMEYTVQEAKEYFNHRMYILPSNVKLLTS